MGGIAGFAAIQPVAGAVLYIHDYAWTHTEPAVRRRILEQFPGPADVEFGLVADPQGWFDGLYHEAYEAYGVKPGHAHVNVLAEHLRADWAHFVQAARRRGFASVAPILAPNQGEYRAGPFSVASWEPYRVAARLGGGLTVDAPVDLYLSQPAAYRRFVTDEVRWARKSGLHSAFILSPGNAGKRFDAEVIAVADDLRAHGATPDEFIVETYGGGSDVPHDVAGAARLLLSHLPGHQRGL